jgi:hypothetical protein
MIGVFEQDVRSAPGAFDWQGSSDVSRVMEWLEASGRRVPEDLITLWAQTGGGDMFETEEVLSPTATDDHDLEAVNRRLWAAGLAEELLVFHRGLYLTAVDASERIVRVDPDRLEPVGFFASIGDWYADLRGEYARSYGLPLRRAC